MNATETALAAADDYLAALSRCRPQEDDPIPIANGPEARRLFRAALPGQPEEVRAAAINRLAAGLPAISDPMAAGIMAGQVGSLIEDDADPAALGEAMRPRLQADFAAARRFVERIEAETGIERPADADPAVLAKLGEQDRIGASAWAALQFSTISGMAAWCRHRPSRLLAKAAPGLADDARFLGERGGYCYWISELLSAADGTRITVLSPEQNKGYIVELECVRNAAHLFVLLEDTIVGDPQDGWLTGPRADAAAAPVARGEENGKHGQMFEIGWHYEYWWGLNPAGMAARIGLHPLAAAMIGVEATVDDLPAFRGEAVLFMRPKWLGSRQCDMSFFAPLHEALRSRVHVLRTLTASEVETLINDLKAEAETL